MNPTLALLLLRCIQWLLQHISINRAALMLQSTVRLMADDTPQHGLASLVALRANMLSFCIGFNTQHAKMFFLEKDAQLGSTTSSSGTRRDGIMTLTGGTSAILSIK